MGFLTPSFALCANDKDELELDFRPDGSVDVKDPLAKIGANFLSITAGVAVVIAENSQVTPTIGLRWRALPQLPNKPRLNLASPDFLTLSIGAESIITDLSWEIVPEIVCIGGGVAYLPAEGRPFEHSLGAAIHLQILKF